MPTSPRRRRALRWGLAVGWAALIFVVSSMPGSNLPGGFSFEAHFFEYAIFGGLLYSALRLDRSTPSAILWAVALASLYAITDEYHQSFVPMRTPDPLDWVVDTVGAAFGAVVVWGVSGVLGRARSRRASEESG